MSTRCFLCKSRVGLLGFKCKFCKNNLCTYHRLPEDHNCPNIDLAKNKYKEMNKKKLESESLKETKVIEV